nr:PREDICTED: uncharacterized protein LOC109036564 [Bemisia tabaci]
MPNYLCLNALFFPLLIVTFTQGFLISENKKSGDVQGFPWFPLEPNPPSVAGPKKLDMFKWINDTCDNGKMNLTVDWDFSPVNYSCFTSKKLIPDASIPSELFSKVLPPVHRAAHLCMNEKIEYDTNIPMFGNHRPAWAKWGEYVFLPKQRWLHNLEHGAIVMLYHPCTHPAFVSALREMVTGCLYRHIITADNSLSTSHPMALVAWGHKILLSYPSEKVVKNFIRQYAKKGPEETSRQGYYDELLINPSNIVTDLDDKELCPERQKK